MYPGDEKREVGRKAIECQQSGLMRRYPEMERVEVPYEGQSLPAFTAWKTMPSGSVYTELSPALLNGSLST